MAGRRPAGARYPHATTDAKEADHRFCPVLEAVRSRIDSGREQWGQLHEMPPVADEASAIDAKKGLYRARNHTGKKRGACSPVAVSVQADYNKLSDGTYQVWFRVFRRQDAKREIAQRVNRGEELAYNVHRK